MIIDTHTHLNASPLFEDREEIIKRAKANNIVAVFNNADSLESFIEIDRLSKEYPSFCYGVYGVHPEFASVTKIEDVYKEIEKRKDIVKAIGEIGLDYHYQVSEEGKENQKKIFIAQILLAKKMNLPIVIHSRDADQDTYDILCEYAKDMKVDLHCYSGSSEMAKLYYKNIPSIHFGIGGIITFKNARKLVEVVTSIPLENLLTETDAPYLTPAPYRGKTNEPSYLPFVIKRIAELKNKSEEETEDILYNNAKNFYNI